MQIQQLVSHIPYQILQGEPESVQVTGIADHSGRVQPGDLFVCFAGLKTNGARYLQEAWNRGAAAALTETMPEYMPRGMPVLKVPSLKEYAGQIAAAFHEWPSRSMGIIGITGTNGKTSTAIMLHHILMDVGIRTGLIGTIDNYVDNRWEHAHHTTPQAIELQELLSTMRDGGEIKVVMEVSSHALDQHRDEGVEYEIAVFTNLTQDHLDYHQTMERYAAAKGRLFERCRCGLLNGDDPRWRYFAGRCPGKVYTFGFGLDTDFRATGAAWNTEGVEFEWYFRDRYLGHIRYPAPGQFQIYNVLAAASAAWLEKVPEQRICQAMNVMEPLVEGRFQRIRGEDGLQVIIDYAHTPDGLEQAMKSCRDICQGQFITVFGCGGNRDRIKRPIMGELAGRYSDRVIVTSDNPRWERPEAIIQDILQGVQKTSTSYLAMEDRSQAILKAIEEAGPQDVVLIAGKGHEKVQQVGNSRIAFDDAAWVREALTKRKHEKYP